MLGRYTAIGPYSDAAQADRDDWLDRSAYLLLSRIEDGDALSVAELADALRAGRRRPCSRRPRYCCATICSTAPRSRPAASADAARPRAAVPHRTHKIDGLRQVLDSWSTTDIEVLVSSIGRLVASIDDDGRHSEAAVTEPIRLPDPRGQRPKRDLTSLGPEMLDDEAEQRDGAGQQDADGLADRPAHLDRQVGRGTAGRRSTPSRAPRRSTSADCPP